MLCGASGCFCFFKMRPKKKKHFPPSLSGGRGLTSLGVLRGHRRPGRQLRVQVLDLGVLGEQELLEAADLRLVGPHSERSHQIRRAAARTLQKAVSVETYTVYLSVAVSTAHARNNSYKKYKNN